jgi:hypothetical protein
VARAELLLGDLLARAGRREEATTRWRAAAARAKMAAERGDLPAITLLATAQFQMGSVADARALAQRIESSHFRHPAFADLKQKLASGAGLLAEKP